MLSSHLSIFYTETNACTCYIHMDYNYVLSALISFSTIVIHIIITCIHTYDVVCDVHVSLVDDDLVSSSSSCNRGTVCGYT